MNWFGKPKKYVFIQTGFAGEWRRTKLHSEHPMMACRYADEFYYLLPDGTVEGKPEIKWRREGEPPSGA